MKPEDPKEPKEPEVKPEDPKEPKEPVKPEDPKEPKEPEVKPEVRLEKLIKEPQVKQKEITENRGSVSMDDVSWCWNFILSWRSIIRIR